MVGVDKLRLLLRITEEQTALQVPSGVRHWFDASGNQNVEGMIGRDGRRDMFVRVNLGKGHLAVEFNPSRLSAPDGGLCRFEDLGLALNCALAVVDAEVGIYVLPEHRSDSAVQRIDVARDFAVRDARNFILALLSIRRPRATRLELHYDPQMLLLSGIVSGNRTSNVKLYVRQGGHPEFADADWVRFETQARDSWLPRLLPEEQRDRAVLFRDLTPENLQRLLKDRWQWSRFGTPAAAESRWWASAHKQLPVTQLRALAAWLYAVEHGQDLGYSKETIDNFHRTLAAIGVPVPVPAHGAAASRRQLQLRRDVPRSMPLSRRSALPPTPSPGLAGWRTALTRPVCE